MLKKFDSPYIPPTFCSFPPLFSLLPMKGQIPPTVEESPYEWQHWHWQEIVMKPWFQCSTQFSWPSCTSLARLWKMSWLTLRGWRVFYIGSNNHNNYTCRNYIFCLNLPFENVWKLFYLYQVFSIISELNKEFPAILLVERLVLWRYIHHATQ